MQVTTDPAYAVQNAARHMSRGAFPTAKSQNQRENFSALLNTTDEQGEHTVLDMAPPITSSNKTQSTPSPADVYEQLTLREAPAAERTSTTVQGVQWTDELLASFAGGFNGVPIDTAKAINWNSTGTKTLTDEQSAALREKYDINNLSSQDYYDLMADLTQMDVLRAEDIHGMHFRKMTVSESRSFGSIRPSDGSRDPRYSFASGNFFKALMQNLEEARTERAYMQSDVFWKENPTFDRDIYNDHLNYWEKRLESMNKMEQVFNSIRR